MFVARSCCGSSVAKQFPRWLWAPAFAGTTSRMRRRRGLLHPSLGRRGRGIDHVVDFLTPAQNLGRKHGVIESLQVEVVDRLSLDPLLDHAVDAAAHHDLAGLGLVAQAGGEVGDAADRGIFQALLKADLAERGVAERNADTEGEVVAAVAPAPAQPANGVN